MRLTLGERPEEPIDWEHIDCCLAEKHGLTPLDVDRLTLSEIAILLQDPSKRDNMPDAEISERLAAWRRLTPRQKLERGAGDE